MSVKMMAQVLRHVQRLGAQEDILTGVLSAALERDQAFAAAFFQAVVKGSSVNADEYFTDFPKDYGLITGDKVSKKRYAWIEDKRITFAPDIWIFDKNAEEWDEVKPRPHPSFHFLIECKEGARVTKNQARGYPFFEDDLFGKTQPRVFTLLIYGEAQEDEKKMFSHHLSWQEVGELFGQCLDALSPNEVQDDLRGLHEIYRYQLAFDFASQRESVDAEASEALLRWIRTRLPCEGTLEPRAHPSAKPLGKWLCLNSDQKLQLWLRAERKDQVYALQVETWLDQAMTGKPIKFLLAESTDGCQTLLDAIRKEQQKFSDGLL